MGLTFLNNCFGDVKDLLMMAPADYAGGAIWDVVVKINTGIQGIGYGPVSYTHLDVYKRQVNYTLTFKNAIKPRKNCKGEYYEV